MSFAKPGTVHEMELVITESGVETSRERVKFRILKKASPPKKQPPYCSDLDKRPQLYQAYFNGFRRGKRAANPDKPFHRKMWLNRLRRMERETFRQMGVAL